MSESTVVPDVVTPRCAWCGAMPATPLSVSHLVAPNSYTLTEDTCDDCQTEAWQAVMRVRQEARQRKERAR